MSYRVKAVMSTVEEMSQIVRTAAEPWSPGDSVKAAINRAARRLRLSIRRATTFWYARPCTVLASEADALRAWKRQNEFLEIARLERRLEELRAAHADLKGRSDAAILDGAIGAADGPKRMVPQAGEAEV